MKKSILKEALNPSTILYPSFWLRILAVIMFIDFLAVICDIDVSNGYQNIEWSQFNMFMIIKILACIVIALSVSSCFVYGLELCCILYYLIFKPNIYPSKYYVSIEDAKSNALLKNNKTLYEHVSKIENTNRIRSLNIGALLIIFASVWNGNLENDLLENYPVYEIYILIVINVIILAFMWFNNYLIYNNKHINRSSIEEK